MSSLIRFARTGHRILTNRCIKTNMAKRKMGGFDGELQYRGEIPNHPAWVWNLSASITFVMTCWIGYMVYNHTGHVTGEFPDIHPEEWTDEELGIPPDDEDIYPPGYIPLAQR